MGYIARWTRRILMFVLPLFTLSACRDATGPDPRLQSAAGTYLLTHVNTKAIPTEWYRDAVHRYSILSGELILRVDGTFVETGTVKSENFVDDFSMTTTVSGQGRFVITRTYPLAQGRDTITVSEVTFTTDVHAADPTTGVPRWFGVLGDRELTYHSTDSDLFSYRRT